MESLGKKTHNLGDDYHNKRDIKAKQSHGEAYE